MTELEAGENAGLEGQRAVEGATPTRRGPRVERFAAIDLGTNNCRLLVAAPRGQNFRIVDAFSKIVRLGEGLLQSGSLSKEAMARAVDALKICAEKIARRNVTHMRCIATQACRGAANGAEFLEVVRNQTGLNFEIISPEEEARLAVRGCADLLDQNSSAGLIFDIGGGSTELSWVRPGEGAAAAEIVAWKSMPFGVVMLSEKWGGREIDSEKFAKMVESVRAEIRVLGDPANLKYVFENDDAHFLGTSGTITSIAGVHLELRRYKRDRVDGLWLDSDDVRSVSQKLRAMNFDERAREPCIGEERADLVVCGCAILEALLLEWPVTRVRVADRGLREGILADLARQAQRQRRKNRRRGRRKKRLQSDASNS